MRRIEASQPAKDPPGRVMRHKVQTPFLVLAACCAASELVPAASCSAPAAEIGGSLDHGSKLTPAEADAALDAWRPVPTPGQAGSPAAPAVLRTADFARSDPRFAGLILRCNNNQRIEPVIVVVGPFLATAQPKITLRVAGGESYFTGTILPTGVGIRLPLEVGEMASGPWLGAEELAVTIAEGDTVISGVVNLAGLATAITSLRAECVQK